jgi:NADH-quinone oxidoreductase subunit C
MYEEFVGHPLRKDYPIDKRQPLIEMRGVREVPTQRDPSPELLNRP